MAVPPTLHLGAKEFTHTCRISWAVKAGGFAFVLGRVRRLCSWGSMVHARCRADESPFSTPQRGDGRALAYCPLVSVWAGPLLHRDDEPTDVVLPADAAKATVIGLREVTVGNRPLIAMLNVDAASPPLVPQARDALSKGVDWLTNLDLLSVGTKFEERLVGLQTPRGCT